jgi:hypothetical protein
MAMPARPSGTPTITGQRTRSPNMSRPSKTIQIGEVETSSAATPDGMNCSAHATPPLPPPRRSAPMTSDDSHWRRSGRSPVTSPRRMATT